MFILLGLITLIWKTHFVLKSEQANGPVGLKKKNTAAFSD
jgi:hypothetical protein